MPKTFALVLFISSLVLQAQPHWEMHNTGSTSSLRGLSAVSAEVCWTSGSEGKVFRTWDGGKSWQEISPKGYGELQFRDIEALDDSTALVISAGLPAVILRTTDAGHSWKEVYRNESEGVFFDAMDFWNKSQGIAFSDAPKRRLLLIRTIDGGQSWKELPRSSQPRVKRGQGGFAASGTCLRSFGQSSVAIGLGGEEASVWISHNFGEDWQKSLTPLDAGEASRGVFSVDILPNGLGYAVGGDYRADSLSNMSVAITTDKGESWFSLYAPQVQRKYHSCVLMLSEDRIILSSRTGSHLTLDAGQNWQPLEGKFYSLSATKDGVVWASGPGGRVAVLRWK